MSFLNPFVAARETSGNLDIIAPRNEESIGTEESLADSQLSKSPVPQQLASPEGETTISISTGPSTSSSKSGGKKRKATSQDLVDTEILKALQKEPDNEHELFFKSLIPTVSQLDPINTMLFRAEVQHLAVKYLRQQQASSRSSTPASFLPIHQEAMREQRFYQQFSTAPE